MRTIKKIIIHCTATPEGRTVTKQDIEMWHRARGFSKIGYHYLIHLDGSVSYGRDVSEPGAHCKGLNKSSIGVAYVGGLDKYGKEPKDTRTENQRLALRRLVADLQKEYPGATVHGHYEFAAKACPSFKIEDL